MKTAPISHWAIALAITLLVGAIAAQDGPSEAEIADAIAQDVADAKAQARAEFLAQSRAALGPQEASP